MWLYLLNNQKLRNLLWLLELEHWNLGLQISDFSILLVLKWEVSEVSRTKDNFNMKKKNIWEPNARSRAKKYKIFQPFSKSKCSSGSSNEYDYDTMVDVGGVEINIITTPNNRTEADTNKKSDNCYLGLKFCIYFFILILIGGRSCSVFQSG